MVRDDHRPVVTLRFGDRVEAFFAESAAVFGREILAAAARAKRLEQALRDRELVSKLLDGPADDPFRVGWQSYGRVLAKRRRR